MSLPTTAEAIIIIALVFVPGIIFGLLIRRAISHFPTQMDARQIIVMGASGLFLHTLVFPFGTRFVVDWYGDGRIEEYWLASYIWFVFTIFVWPVLAGVALSKLIKLEWIDAQLDKVGLGHVDRTSSAWDWTIDLRESRWVRVYLRDGSIIGGFYGTSSWV